MKQGALELAQEILESLEFQEKRQNVDLPTRVANAANMLRIK